MTIYPDMNFLVGGIVSVCKLTDGTIVSNILIVTMPDGKEYEIYDENQFDIKERVGGK